LKLGDPTRLHNSTPHAKGSFIRQNSRYNIFNLIFKLFIKNIITFEAMKVMMNKIVWRISLALLICGYIKASDICISNIYISGNKQTKEFTILRELPFHTGDIMSEDKLIHQLQVATEHLNNTSLFNYVHIDYMPDTLNRDNCLSCIVTIQVEERWYYWPQVSLKLEDRNLSAWLHEKNFNRVTIGWGLRIYNVFGMRHKIAVSHYFGYEKGLRLSYSNIALDKKRTKMLGFSTSMLFNKNLNVGSEKNKVIYIKDPDNFLDRTFEGMIRYSYRPGIRNTHAIDIGYQRTHLGDTILKINENYWGSDNPVNHAFKLSYDYSYEHRNYIAYPTKGYYAGTEIKGITADKMHFFYGELNLKLQYYEEIFSRWFWSSRLNTGITVKNKRAYTYDRHVGYEDKNITGYDYYVIDGQRYAILNNDIRFLLMPEKIFNLDSSRTTSKFKKIHISLYAKLMYDVGYVHNKYRDEAHTLANAFLWGSGLGLDLVTYYDVVLNCSYAINKMGEGRFYFGIKAPLF
jgi:outer membrane protein assembly factor BamA